MQSQLAHDVSTIIVRDLGTLAEVVNRMPESHLWMASPGIINSVGTLVVHMCGNLRHFIGQALGNDGYQRDREAEFSHTVFPKEDLMAEIEATRTAVKNALAELTDDQLLQPMPDTPPQHAGRTTGFFLVQLCCHLSWHRGQVDYLSRILMAKDMQSGS